MKSHFHLLFIILVFYSCNSSESNNITEPIINQNDLDDDANDSIIEEFNSKNLNYSIPTTIDSTDWIFYNLTHGEHDNYSKSLLNKSEQLPYGIWNIIFYNLKTREQHLLSDSLKMIITNNSYHKSTSQRSTKDGDLFYYTIIVEDFNQDQQLTHEDPQYLFISDIDGKNFKQISPNNFDVLNYEIINDKVLIQTINDSNADKIFNQEDDVFNYIYDLKSENLQKTLNKSFIQKMKKLHYNQWNNRKE